MYWKCNTTLSQGTPSKIIVSTLPKSLLLHFLPQWTSSYKKVLKGGFKINLRTFLWKCSITFKCNHFLNYDDHHFETDFLFLGEKRRNTKSGWPAKKRIWRMTQRKKIWNLWEISGAAADLTKTKSFFEITSSTKASRTNKRYEFGHSPNAINIVLLFRDFYSALYFATFFSDFFEKRFFLAWEKLCQFLKLLIKS